MDRKLVMMGAASVLVMIAGITLAQQDEAGLISQEEFERIERESASGVVSRGLTRAVFGYANGCVSRIVVQTGSGPNAGRLSGFFMINDGTSGETMFGFTPNGIRLGSYAQDALTATQWASFEPVMAQLRHAVQENASVSIQYVGDPAYIVWFAVFPNSPAPC